MHLAFCITLSLLLTRYSIALSRQLHSASLKDELILQKRSPLPPVSGDNLPPLSPSYPPPNNAEDLTLDELLSSWLAREIAKEPARVPLPASSSWPDEQPSLGLIPVHFGPSSSASTRGKDKAVEQVESIEPQQSIDSIEYLYDTSDSSRPNSDSVYNMSREDEEQETEPTTAASTKSQRRRKQKGQMYPWPIDDYSEKRYKLAFEPYERMKRRGERFQLDARDRLILDKPGVRMFEALRTRAWTRARYAKARKPLKHGKASMTARIRGLRKKLHAIGARQKEGTLFTKQDLEDILHYQDTQAHVQVSEELLRVAKRHRNLIQESWHHDPYLRFAHFETNPFPLLDKVPLPPSPPPPPTLQ